jgi:hypothetical protein
MCRRTAAPAVLLRHVRKQHAERTCFPPHRPPGMTVRLPLRLAGQDIASDKRTDGIAERRVLGVGAERA